jgi:YidC/Oxa1 family membrane protein insertase
MDRNFFLAMALIIVVVIGYQFYFHSIAPPPKKKPPVTTEKVAKKRPSVSETAAEQPKESPQAAKPPKPAVESITLPSQAGKAVGPAKETLIKVNSLKYEAVLSSKGARLVSFKLKDYRKWLGKPQLVDLFHREGPDTSGPTVRLTRRNETLDDAELGYVLQGKETNVELNEKGAKKTITFRAEGPGGLIFEKAYTFHADLYLVGLEVKVTNRTQSDRNYLASFKWKKVYRGEPKQGWFTGGSGAYEWNSAEILLDGELKDYYFSHIKGEEEPSGKIQWAGLGDRYFFKALVFGRKPARKVTLFKPSSKGFAEIWVRYGALDLGPSKASKMDLSIYLGPKEHYALVAAGHDLSRALYYSKYRILDMLAQYLVEFLRYCHTGFTVAGLRIPGTHNWGLDIIILTVLIRLLFIPLTHKSHKSMKKMQELQPQIAKLKEKYKDDKAAVNKATMELFREYKVNPVGGCWPMFLQLPVFFALYLGLAYAIELRQSAFVCIPSIFLCIKDLSAPDPYYVTPSLMGISMVAQQWMTPSAGDPMQKKMMLMMPVVFTFLFLSFPSGLVLYWLVSNLLQISQQVIENRWVGHKE